MSHFPQVLSIQSHVVKGYVGNRSAVFPLERLGCHVDVINSVQFASSRVHEGQRISGDELHTILRGLIITQSEEEEETGCNNDVAKRKIRELLKNSGEKKEKSKESFEYAVKSVKWKYTHVLTGYVGKACFLREVANFIRYMKQSICYYPNSCDYEANECEHNAKKMKLSSKMVEPEIDDTVVQNLSIDGTAKSLKNLVWLCDPVLGDEGKFYVEKELLSIYQNDVVPYVDILTPNQFELECLTGIKTTFLHDIFLCFEYLHSRGPSIVVVTSAFFRSKGTENKHFAAEEMVEEKDSDYLFLMASQKIAVNEENTKIHIDKETMESQKSRKKKIIEEYAGFNNIISMSELDTIKNKKIVMIKFQKKKLLLRGTGDLLASLLLFNLQRSDIDFQHACELSVSSVQSVILQSLAESKNCQEVDVVAAQNCFQNPSSYFKGVLL